MSTYLVSARGPGRLTRAWARIAWRLWRSRHWTTVGHTTDEPAPGDVIQAPENDADVIQVQAWDGTVARTYTAPPPTPWRAPRRGYYSAACEHGVMYGECCPPAEHGPPPKIPARPPGPR